MAKFTVQFSLVGGGHVEVDAANAEEAEDMVSKMTTEQLIAEADFDDGLSIVQITS